MTALVTPFLSDKSLDEEGFRRNLHFQIEEQVDAIVVLGTTGEASTLSFQEKQKVLEIARIENNTAIPLIAGTGCESTERTIEMTKMAKAIGADAALIVVPYYNKPTQEGIYQHFATIAEAVDLPFIVYNHPGRTGSIIEIPTLQRLVNIPQIIGIKEVTGKMQRMMEVIESLQKHRSDFSIFCGDDIMTLPSVALGAHGVISAISNIFPQKMKNLVKAVAQGDYDTAQELNSELLPFFKASSLETNPIPIKAMMNVMGMAAGPLRSPLCEMKGDNLDVIKQTLQLALVELK